MSDDHKHPNYMLIFFALLVLTVAEVVVAFFPRWFENTWIIPATIISLVVMAFVKAGLVGAYFMHLKFEKPAFIVIVCFPLILMVFLVFMLFPDVALVGS